ncbi:MAG: SusD/RagB family nutrient-binding outer membrane lipoprotein [Carboxylicivirga sp.]|jgi:hypothetical protein|nr:SusD/RagB family nutrient-binding outer membrane lipoprotein [Carboxylicivirga sp.]
MKVLNCYYTKISSVLILLLTLSACEDFDDINTPKTGVTSPDPSSLFPELITVPSKDNGRQSINLFNKLVQYTTRGEDVIGDKWDVESISPWWDVTYNTMRHANIVLEAGEGYENHKGAALVIKSYVFYVLTSLYGDIPYSEAGQGMEGSYFPKYDTQEEVFKGLITDLEQANSLLGTGTINMTADILYDGDVLKWKKFANSLLIRVLMAQSSQVNPSVKLQAIIDNPETYPIFEDYTDQPTFKYSSSVDFEYSGWLESTYACKTYVDIVKGLGDERIKTAASLSVNGSEYIGAPQATNDLIEADDVSLQSSLILDNRTHPFVQTVWMQTAELQLLLAEAVEKGYLSGGSDVAEAYYQAGIKSSYEYQKSLNDKVVEAGLMMEPMDDFNESYYLKPEVAFTSETEANLTKINTQMYIALFNDMEMYFYQRRTVTPELVVGVLHRNEGRPPVRFIYPESEKSLNTDAYEEAIRRQGADDVNTKMWLLK